MHPLSLFFGVDKRILQGRYSNGIPNLDLVLKAFTAWRAEPR